MSKAYDAVVQRVKDEIATEGEKMYTRSPEDIRAHAQYMVESAIRGHHFAYDVDDDFECGAYSPDEKELFYELTGNVKVHFDDTPDPDMDSTVPFVDTNEIARAKKALKVLGFNDENYAETIARVVLEAARTNRVENATN